MKVYVYSNGQIVGPYPVEEINSMLRDGRISMHDQVCFLGTDEWIAMSGLPGVSAPESSDTSSVAVDQLPGVDDGEASSVSVFRWFANRSSASRRKMVAVLVGIAALGFLYFMVVGGPQTIRGKVFRVNESGRSFKIALAKVDVYKLSDIKAEVELKQNELRQLKVELDDKEKVWREKANISNPAWMKTLDAVTTGDENAEALEKISEPLQRTTEIARGQYEAVEKQWYAYLNVPDFFGDFPSPIATTVTDADGVFSLKVNGRGSFAVAVSATKSEDGRSQYFYWLVLAPRDQNGEKELVLSDNNMISKESKETLLLTIK